MKSNPFRKLALVTSALALLFGPALAPLAAANEKAKAADPKAKASTAAAPEKTEARPPLKIATDSKPIDRNAADRVSYAPIVKKTAASVVYVYSSKTVRGQDISPLLNDPLFRRFFEAPGLPGGGRDDDQDARPSTPGRNRPPRSNRLPDQTQQGLGSGIVITADGYILTNNHIVEDADDVRVAIGDSNKRYEAKVIGRDAFADIAVLKIEATGLSPATFGDSEQLEIGDVVLAIGNPFGVGQSVSRGIVSALSRGVGAGVIEDFIQTDAAINPGNSGGALIDTQGRVVGINTAILSRSGGFNGVGFAIPINLVRSIAEQLVNTGRVERGFLGVGQQELTEELTEQFGIEKGALINDVSPGSPAEKAGLRSGDVITKINDVEIRDGRHLLLTVSQMRPETKVTVEFLRDNKRETVSAVLASRPNDTAASTGPTEGKDVGVLNGVGVSDITPELREQLDIPARIQGALITSVEADSPSAEQGLREGDIILELNRRPVKDANEAVKLSEEIKGPKVMVRLWRNGRTQFVVVDESK